MADNSGAVDLGSLSQDEREAVEQLADTNPPEAEPRKALTAFVVVVGFDGNPEVMAFEDEELVVQVHPTPDLVFAACSTVVKDLQAQETAQHAAALTAQFMTQQARAMMEQQQAEAIRAGLHL